MCATIPVFIDSRIDIYEYSGVFADYLDAIGVKNTLEILDKYHIRYVLYQQESPVAYLLMHNAGWKSRLSGWDDGVAGADADSAKTWPSYGHLISRCRRPVQRLSRDRRCECRRHSCVTSGRPTLV